MIKRNLSRFIIVVFVFILIVGFEIVSAAGATRPFGGQITNTKATEIQSMENSNYSCNVPGTSITIKPINKSSPTTFLIPTNVKSKTGTTPRNGMQIKGLYSQTKTSIVCKYRGYPPSQSTVTLTPITMYGTSKQ